MKKHIFLCLYFLIVCLRTIAQEQPAEYYGMKYFPYSPYGVSIEQLENYYKDDPDFIRDSSISLPHLIFRYTSKKVPPSVTGADSLSVFFTKSKLIRNSDTVPILTYNIIYFFPITMTQKEIKHHVNSVRFDFRKKYVHSFETTGKSEVKPKPRILIVKNSQFSTGDITVSDGVIINNPAQYYLQLSVILLPEDETKTMK